MVEVSPPTTTSLYGHGTGPWPAATARTGRTRCVNNAPGDAILEVMNVGFSLGWWEKKWVHHGVYHQYIVGIWYHRFIGNHQ